VLIFGILGFIHLEVQKEMLSKLKLTPKTVDKVLKEINTILAEKYTKI